MCWRVDRSFRADTRAPGAARDFVDVELTRRFAPIARPPVIDDALLVVSELVTNALRAGSSSASVLVRLHRAELEIAVTDDAPGQPEVQHAAPSESHGRGLLIVQMVAAQWGTDNLPVGKCVWAALALPTPVALAAVCGERSRLVSA
jgi:signal transduction histidine kinase